jgi:hypothetical protein
MLDAVALYRCFARSLKALAIDIEGRARPLHRPRNRREILRLAREKTERSRNLSRRMLSLCTSEFRRPLSPDTAEQRLAIGARTLAMVRRSLRLGPDSDEYRVLHAFFRSSTSHSDGAASLPKKVRRARKEAIRLYDLDLQKLGNRLGIWTPTAE